MPTETGSMTELIEKLSKTDDPRGILELAKEINKGSVIVKVKIDDPNAACYPFMFKRDDMVVSKTETSIDLDSKGEIVDGEYEGAARPGGSYSIIYTVKRLKDGLYYDAKELGLTRV
jgi:hypothetical protein